MADPGISLHDVVKNYDAPGNSVPALATTSLDVRQGEMLVLLGPSGCGKTTLLRMIGGLIKPPIIRSSVVLPQPDGPSSTSISPCRTSSDVVASAGTELPGAS